MDINSIIRSNTGLVFVQLKRLKVLNDPDAESIGYEALWNAAATYEAEKGYKFSTYATCCIYNALGSYIRTLNKKKQLDTVSYNNIAYNNDGDSHEFLELFASAVDIEQDVMKGELYRKLNDIYQVAYDRLTNPKHKAIAKAWRDADYSISNKDIAKIAGVSQPYVNQVISTFKFNIKKRVEAYYNE